MGVGQIISDTFGTVKDRFGQLVGLWAIYFVITIALFVVFTVGMGAGLVGIASMAEGGSMGLGAGMVVMLILFYVVYLLVVMAEYASLIQMASPLGRPTFGDALGAGWRAAPALLLLLLVLMVAYIAFALVFSVVGIAVAAMGDAGSTLLLLLVLPVLVWIGCRLLPLFAVVAVDGVRNPFTAIARAWRMTRGHALTIFLAWLAFVVLLVVICGVALLPSFGMLSSLADPTGFGDPAASTNWGMGAILLLVLGMLFVSVAFTVTYAAFLAVVHGRLSDTAGERAAEAFS